MAKIKVEPARVLEIVSVPSPVTHRIAISHQNKKLTEDISIHEIRNLTKLNRFLGCGDLAIQFCGQLTVDLLQTKKYLD